MHIVYVNPHWTDISTGITLCACFFIVNSNMEETDFIKWRENRSNWTKVFAPSAFDREDEDEEENENHQCNPEEIIRHLFPWIQNQNRNGSCEKTNRADICENKPYQIRC